MSKLAGQTSRAFSFGPFVLIPERRLLLSGEVPVRLGGRALDLLTFLVEHAGETVSKRELIAHAWPTVVVEEGNLKVNMAALRRVLGDSPSQVQFIATIPGRGYRFVASVKSSAGLPGSATDGLIGQDGPNNLPIATTRIIGRAAEIATVQERLQASRLVSIVGPGGIGKTTVALSVAEAALGTFEDGVFLVDLAPVKDASSVPQAVATAVGFAASSPSMLAALVGHLRKRRMLLILDSCEHLVESTASCVEKILSNAAAVKIIATSREPLGVSGERVFRLPGLDGPPVSTSIRAAEAQGFPAVQLFVDRAIDRLDSYRLSDTDAPLVAEICRRVDGLALAIELAATQVGTFGVGGVLKQLNGRIHLLHGQRSGAERHRTLKATIDWSYELLSSSEQIVMRRLSAFAGLFSLESACAIASDDHLGGDEVSEVLAYLVAKSLLAAAVTDTDANYRQLDTTRAFAFERLAAADDMAATRTRHARYFLQRAEAAAGKDGYLSPQDWVAHHAGLIGDLRRALSWACEESQNDELAVRLTVGMIPFWKRLSLVEECRLAVEKILSARFEPARSARDDLTLHLALGATILHTQGPLVEVKASLMRALQIATDLDDVHLQLECLGGLSEFELWSGDSRSALAVAEQIRSLAARQHLGAAAINADAQAGSAFWYLADFTASRRSFESIISRPVPLDLRSDAARSEFSQRLTAQGNLASLLWLQGMADQALAMSRRQRAEAEASGNAVLLCYALLHGSAVVSLYVRDVKAAGEFLDSGATLAQEHGLTIWQIMSVMVRGRWLLDVNLPFDISAYRDALVELRGRGFRMRYPNYLTNYGEALARSGDVDQGLSVLNDAMDLAASNGNVVGVPEMLRIKGSVLMLKGPGSWQDASECFVQSVELAKKQGGIAWVLRTAMSWVELTRTQGRDDAAERTLTAAYAQFNEGFESGDLRRARTLLAESHRGGGT